MSPQTWRAVIALVIFAHGIGHTMGVLAALPRPNVEGWNADSWLLTDILGENPARILAGILFAGLTISFTVVTLALLDWVVPHDWWRSLAVVSAIVSLVALALFWNAFVALIPNKVGAIAVNLAIVIGLLIADWPTESDIGF